MDVDLLRPGTVPLSPDTILWFEFLLDQQLLKKHLDDPYSEPTATELIVEFLSVDASSGWKPSEMERLPLDIDAPPTPPDSLSPVMPTITRKQLALKILALKIAATLNWNLDTFELQLPPIIQQQLVQDLVYMATDGLFSVPPQELTSELLQKPQVDFALGLYHRWILRFPVKAALQAKSAKLPFIHNPGIPLENGFAHITSNFDHILRFSESSRIESLNYLEDLLVDYRDAVGAKFKKIKIPVMESFVHLTEDSDILDHDWETGDIFISQYELAMQIHFDLCFNYFFYGQHEMAKKHILRCRENLTLLENEVSKYGYGKHKEVPWGSFYYASVSKDDIFGYIRALNLGFELLNEEPPLLQMLQESITNHYIGIIGVLQADNITREIPMIHRQVVELDIQGSASSGAFTVARDLLIRVSALNAVRYAFEGGLPSTYPEFLNKFKSVGTKFFEMLFWAMAPVLMTELSEDDWENLRMFFLHLSTSTQCSLPIDKVDEYLQKYMGDAAEVVREKLICDEHLRVILTDQVNSDDEHMDIPQQLLTDEWQAPKSDARLVPELEMGRLKKRLVEATTADDVRMCLVKLAVMSPATPLWKFTPYYRPPGGLAAVLSSLPRGFLQDFGYVVWGVARARAEAGNARGALSLLAVLEGEARSQLGGGSCPKLIRLCRLLGWELLLMQINLMLAEWPHHRVNVTLLVNKCKACIAAFHSGEGIHPRPQVVHAAWMCLLNVGEWETGAPGGGPGELAAALCATCVELQHGKSLRKLPRILWDYILSSLNSGMNGPMKRSHNSYHYHHGNFSNRHGQIEGRGAYHALLHGLREPLAITVVLSVLAKIYNVLIDDSSLELVIEYTNLWPNMITNGNAYNLKNILESMVEILERGLKLYPYNTSWLRLYGDVEMTVGRHGAALRRYLCSLAAGSWHFSKRAPDEGSVARRAARCCQALGAPTQAAALCQLPADPDYATAFKCLAEKTTNAADSMDAYYGCLWDGTLLEVAVAMHARRGEGGRRARAVSAAGALELNANNSEDIQREAAAVRRSRFLRALTKQYVC